MQEASTKKRKPLLVEEGEKVRVPEEPTNWTILDGTIIKRLKNRSYVVENEKRAYRRNSQHLAPQHQPTLPQIHQSDRSITETPSDNESPDLKKSPNLKKLPSATSWQ